jgi:hypothetical protein
MELKPNRYYPLKRVLLYSIVVLLTSTLVTSLFSCLYQPGNFENYKYHFEKSSFSQTFLFVKLTFYFFFFLSTLIAAPGFIINLVLYLNKKFRFYPVKLLSIFVNTAITLIVLFIYNSLDITSSCDFWHIILPCYLVPVVGWGIWILPTQKKV